MENKKHILVCIDWFLPGYKAGGPIRSCANIMETFKDDYYFSVITSDTDFSDTEPYTTIKSNKWNFLENGMRVYYFSKENLNLEAIRKIIEEENPDIVYMNSFFSENFTLKPLLILKNNKHAKKIIAPRGMLGKGALNLKPLKKKIFIFISKLVGIYKDVRWHASTIQEEAEIRGLFGKKADVHVALNLSSIKITELHDKQKERGKLNLVFFSRVSEKKNLHRVFSFLKQMPSQNQVTFDVYGTLEDEEYWKQCEKLIAELPASIKVAYKGVVPSEKISETFANYHFSILPTMHENYGHSIVESFAQGVPVILSDQTPWRNLKQQKTGWDIALSKPGEFIAALQEACNMDNETYNVWQMETIKLAQKILDNREVVSQNKLLFLI